MTAIHDLNVRKSSLERTPASFLLVIMLLSILGLSGCSPIVGAGQPQTANPLPLSPGKTIGQTFVSRQDGLAGLLVFLGPQTPGDGEVWLHLRAGPLGTEDLAAAHLSLSTITTARFYDFRFPAQPGSRGVYYYFTLSLQGQGSLEASSAPGDTYQDGALYIDGTPVDAQMGFLQVFDSQAAALGLARQALTWAGILLIGVFLFILPGWALLSWLLSSWTELGWAEKLGLAGGASLAIYPLIILWTGLVHLHLGALYAWLPPLVGLAALSWKLFRNRRSTKIPFSVPLPAGSPLPGDSPPSGNLQSPVIPPASSDRESPPAGQIPNRSLQLESADLAFLLVLGLVIFTRFWPVHDLDAPMWGDSYQHTLIAQLLVDNRGLFDSWRPYAELSTFTYHFGFHAAAAVFHWVTQLSLLKSVVWTGQLVNILAVLALYPLAVKIGRSRWAGVIAMLVAGLLSSMPMFYLNWGRYTQLSGQVILLACIALAWAFLSQKKLDWRLASLTWIVWSGLALTHYRIFILAVLFYVAYAILEMRKTNAGELVVKTFWSAVGVVVLFLPWFVHVFGGKLVQILTRQLSTPLGNLTGPLEQTNQVGSWLIYLPAALWLLLPICIAWGLWKRSKGIALVGLWWFLVFLAGNPQLLHLPGAGLITGFAVMIAAYIPAALLIGGTVGIAHQETRSAALKSRFFAGKWEPLGVSLLALLLIFFAGLWGARQRMNDAAVSTFALVTRPDLRAFAWIRDNTPEDATFLVNSFVAYNGSSAVGADGGWWLPLLAQRRSTLPPLTYSSEQAYDPNLQSSVKALSLAVSQKGATDPQVLALLAEQNVTYVYIGQKQGRVNNPGPVLDPVALVNSSHFQPVYHQDRVWVFKILP
jgi:hypothetical protein